MVRSHEITRDIGSVRQEPVQYGEPVRAVIVHIIIYIFYIINI